MENNQSVLPHYNTAGFTLACMIPLLTGCAESRAPSETKTRESESEISLVKDISWNDESSILTLSGYADTDSNRIEIVNGVTEEQFGRTNVQQDGRWKFSFDEASALPCNAIVRSGNITETINLKPYGNNCIDSSIRARAVIAPEAHILQPLQNTILNVGEVLRFEGHGVNPAQTTPLKFEWDFDGATQNMNRAVPGEIQFNTPGVYRVRMNVQDENGRRDNTPPVRIIRVQSPDNQAPDSIILEPSTDTVINIGDAINFRGDGNDPEGDGPLDFEWTIEGQANNFRRRNPGQIQFDRVGNFRVEMRTRDVFGAMDQTPAMRMVRVIDRAQGNQNQAPESAIIEPIGNMQIAVGDIVRFRGLGADPEGDNPITYLWDFGGLNQSNLQDPGDVQFNGQGQFEVRMMASDAQGMRDQTPAIVVINVGTFAGGNIDGNNGGQQPNQAPESVIIEPLSDMTINLGDRVRFMGNGVDPQGDNPLAFTWDFDGAAANMNGNDTGDIQFNQVGRYVVRFIASDNQNNRDQTPDQRIITVMNNGNPLNLAPDAHILEPMNDRVINVGDMVRFAGHGVDPEEDPISFEWDFDGATGNDFVRDPGDMIFDREGVYRVRLFAMDDRGNRDQTPEIRTITVIGNNQPPDSLITNPSGDLTIQVGDVVHFEGIGIDPDQDNPLQFEWLFDGAAADIKAEHAGEIQFNRAGRFRVQFMATDAKNMKDPTPETRLIVVQ